METDAMLRLYFKNICPKPSCYQCHYKTIHRISDFTILIAVMPKVHLKHFQIKKRQMYLYIR